MGCCASSNESNSRRREKERPLDDPITGTARGKRRPSETQRPKNPKAKAESTQIKNAPRGKNVALDGEVLRALVAQETTARAELTAMQERQRNMHAFDFEKMMPADDRRIPGSTSTIDFEPDDEEPEDRPRRSTMNSHEYDAAKQVRGKLQQHSRDHRGGAPSPVPPLSMAGVRRHDTEEDCWVVIRGKVYDVTPLLDIHPGGSYAIYQHAGTDATRAFEDAHTRKPMEHLQRYYKGELTGPS